LWKILTEEARKVIGREAGEGADRSFAFFIEGLIHHPII
jgi:hypothetical protein